MRLARDRLIFLALCVLHEAIGRSGAEPLPPAMSIRLALATLFAMSDGTRRPYDDFWNVVTGSLPGFGSETAQAYVRPSYARTHPMAIARTVGLQLTRELEERLERAREKTTARASLSRRVREAAADMEEEEGRAKRDAQQCDLSE